MSSNEDRVDAVLDAMAKNNDPQSFSEGLNILCKLTSKYNFSEVALFQILSNRSLEG
jgi:hypothetical protein